MKLNDSDICVTEVFIVFCEIRCFRFNSMLKKNKTISKKLDPDVSIVSCNSESKVPAKKGLGWVTGVISCANGHK